MKFLTEDARIRCKHQTGVAKIPSSQNLVTIRGRPVLVGSDPALKLIKGCANIGLTIKPCNFTLTITGGHSELVFVDGAPVCLKTLTGLTDGTPPGIVEYVVHRPGQDLVEAEA